MGGVHKDCWLPHFLIASNTNSSGEMNPVYCFQYVPKNMSYRIYLFVLWLPIYWAATKHSSFHHFVAYGDIYYHPGHNKSSLSRYRRIACAFALPCEHVCVSYYSVFMHVFVYRRMNRRSKKKTQDQSAAPLIKWQRGRGNQIEKCHTAHGYHRSGVHQICFLFFFFYPFHSVSALIGAALCRYMRHMSQSSHTQTQSDSHTNAHIKLHKAIGAQL